MGILSWCRRGRLGGTGSPPRMQGRVHAAAPAPPLETAARDAPLHPRRWDGVTADPGQPGNRARPCGTGRSRDAVRDEGSSVLSGAGPKSTKLKQCHLKGLPLKVLYLSTSMAYSVSATDSPSTSPHRTML